MVSLPCVQCGGTCCKNHDGMLLDDGTTLMFNGPQCPFLGEDGLCTIYDIRPRACRIWMCHEQPGFLREHPRVRALLTVNNIPLPV